MDRHKLINVHVCMYVTIYTHMNVSTYGFVFMGMCDKTQLHILIQYQSSYDT